MIIAVDFDGTIVEHRYPSIGKERPGAIDTLKQLVKEGNRIILWTVREGDLLQEAVDFCRSRGLEAPLPQAPGLPSALLRKAGAARPTAQHFCLPSYLLLLCRNSLLTTGFCATK